MLMLSVSCLPPTLHDEGAALPFLIPCSRLASQHRGQSMVKRLRITSSMSPERGRSVSSSPCVCHSLLIRSSVSPDRCASGRASREKEHAKLFLIADAVKHGTGKVWRIKLLRGTRRSLRLEIFNLRTECLQIFGLWRGSLKTKRQSE